MALQPNGRVSLCENRNQRVVVVSGTIGVGMYVGWNVLVNRRLLVLCTLFRGENLLNVYPSCSAVFVDVEACVCVATGIR